MADAKVYKLPAGVGLTETAHGLEDYLRMQKGLETEGAAQSESVYFIQARQTDGWKKFAGMDKAVQVKLTVRGEYLTAEVGAGRWVDKLGAAAVGYILFAPLIITAAIGAIGQERLPQEIFSFIERFLLMGGEPMDIMAGFPEVPEPEPEPEIVPEGDRCRACGSVLPAGARFCSQCGTAVPQKRECPECGTEVAPDAFFCSFCGTKLN